MQRRKFIMMGKHNNHPGRFILDSIPSDTIDNHPMKERKNKHLGNLIVRQALYITEGFIKQPDEKMVYFRGFSQDSGTLDVPAKPLIVPQGEEITISINNTLTTEHSFVIDGIVDSGAIKAGESKTIVFTIQKTGSYLFHDNLNAPFNRLSGLHGGMEVISASKDKHHGIKQPRIKVVNDIDPLWHNQFKNNITPSTPFTPIYFSINGLSIKAIKKTPEQSEFFTQKRTKEYMENRTLYAGINAHTMH